MFEADFFQIQVDLSLKDLVFLVFEIFKSWWIKRLKVKRQLFYVLPLPLVFYLRFANLHFSIHFGKCFRFLTLQSMTDRVSKANEFRNFVISRYLYLFNWTDFMSNTSLKYGVRFHRYFDISKYLITEYLFL